MISGCALFMEGGAVMRWETSRGAEARKERIRLSDEQGPEARAKTAVRRSKLRA